MKFSEKLKKLRADNQMTQEALAEKIFVTRTAISKWETDAGYPNLESLKMLSKVFGVSLDELANDDYIESKRLLEEKQAKRVYWVSLAAFLFALIFAIIFAITKIKLLFVPLVLLTFAFVILSFFSKPKYKRQNLKENWLSILFYILKAAIIFGLGVYTLLQL